MWHKTKGTFLWTQIFCETALGEKKQYTEPHSKVPVYADMLETNDECSTSARPVVASCLQSLEAEEEEELYSI